MKAILNFRNWVSDLFLVHERGKTQSILLEGCLVGNLSVTGSKIKLGKPLRCCTACAFRGINVLGNVRYLYPFLVGGHHQCQATFQYVEDV